MVLTCVVDNEFTVSHKSAVFFTRRENVEESPIESNDFSPSSE